MGDGEQYVGAARVVIVSCKLLQSISLISGGSANRRTSTAIKGDQEL